MYTKVFFFSFLFLITFLRFLTKYSVKLAIIWSRLGDENYHRLLLIARRKRSSKRWLLSKISITLLLSTPVNRHHHDVCRLFDFAWRSSGTKISPKDKSIEERRFTRKEKRRNEYHSCEKKRIRARMIDFYEVFSDFTCIWNIRSS